MGRQRATDQERSRYGDYARIPTSIDASRSDCTTSGRRPETEGEVSAEMRGKHINDDEMSTEEKESREQLARLERDVEMAEKVLESILCRLRCNWGKKDSCNLLAKTKWSLCS